MREPAPYETQR